MQQTRLPNGVSIATCARAGAATAGLAVCVAGGVRAQTTGEGGYAHMVEHLVFEAHARWSGIDAVGKPINAYTGREHIALTGFVPGQDAARLIELFAQMVLDVQFSEAAIAAERERIEIEDARSLESTTDCVEQGVVDTIWPDHPIAQPLAGDACNLAGATASSLQRFWQRVLRGRGTFVFGVGAVDHGEIEAAAHALSALPSDSALDWQTAPRFAGGARREYARASDARVLWVLPMPAPNQKQHDAADLLHRLLTGTTPSRLNHLLGGDLFRAAEVSGQLLRYSDASALAFELEVSGDNTPRARAACENAFDQLARDGFTPSEFHLAQQSIAADRIIESDRLDCQLERLADAVLLRRNVHEPATLERVNALFHQAWPQHARLQWINR